MKKDTLTIPIMLLAMLFVAAAVLQVSSRAFAAQHDHSATQSDKRVPAYYKSLDGVKIPETLSPDKFDDVDNQRAYTVAKNNPKLLMQLPCYCYCDDGMGHQSLLSCYITEHAAHCDTCRNEAIQADRLQREEKLTVEQIREKIIASQGHLPMSSEK
jgi:hypothetical protein